MKVTSLIFWTLSNYLYFRRLPYNRKDKVRILFTLGKLFTVYIILVKCLRLRLRRTHVMGRTVEAYDYVTLYFLFNEIFFRGEYAFPASVASPVIFDCGANLGMATIFFTYFYPNATIYAFEPDPDSFAMLRKNIEHNHLHSSVKLFNVALTDRQGVIDFYSDPARRGSLLSTTLNDEASGTPLPVTGEPLSMHIQQKIDFLKIDIEGAENAVLNELSEKASLGYISQMVIEYHHHIASKPSELSPFLALLEANGYEYQIDAKCVPTCSQGQFQNVIIYSYRR